MRISHEAIYQSLYIEARGALKRELVAALCTGRALRKPRALSRSNPHGHVTEDIVISQRPAEAADRIVPGYWEGYLIIGTGRSAIGSVIERSSRRILLAHFAQTPRLGRHATSEKRPSTRWLRGGPMKAALQATMMRLPSQLRRTLTWDRGTGRATHADFMPATGTRMFFTNPPSPWQHPTNENTNGLLRQYFLKGTDLSQWEAADLETVALTLNNRTRKVLGFKTQAEVFADQLQSSHNSSVATTD
ncbi:hypothetical protein GCM10022249_01660 [Enteractinococcus coprophilus]